MHRASRDRNPAYGARLADGLRSDSGRSLLAGLLIGLLPVCAQSPPPDSERRADPPNVLATIAGVGSIDDREYGRYLVEVLGPVRLRELAFDRVLAHEIARAAREAPELQAVIRKLSAERDERVAERLRARVNTDFGGSEAAFDAYLRRIGSSRAAVLRSLAVEVRRDQWIGELVRRERSARMAAGQAQRALRRAFEDAHGPDGLAVEVQHVFVSFGAIRNRIRERRRGFAATDAEVLRLANERSAAIQAARDDGAEFPELVRRFSHDPLARQLGADPKTAATAGRIAGYRFQRFGSEFATAVRAMQPGQVKGPVRTSHGLHWIWLESRTQTRFADVKDAVIRSWLDSPPTRAERRTLRERLLTKYPIRQPASGKAPK